MAQPRHSLTRASRAQGRWFESGRLCQHDPAAFPYRLEPVDIASIRLGLIVVHSDGLTALAEGAGDEGACERPIDEEGEGLS